MDNILKSYKEFLDIEYETLMLLRNKISVRRLFLHTAYDANKVLLFKNPKGFSFCTHWDIYYNNNECRVLLGAIVRKSSSKDLILSMSHCVCITEGRDLPTGILRKFHFDYVTEDEQKERTEPRFHLQYGGELPQEMEGRGITNEQILSLLPEVRQPRIFFWPMTIGLLMNMIFYEFPTGDSDHILKESYWQNLVRQNERKILKPFYDRCASLAGRDNAIFFDKVYVH